MDIFFERADALIHLLKEKEGTPILARFECSKMTADVISKAAFGFELKSLENQNPIYMDSIDEMMKPDPLLLSIPYWYHGTLMTALSYL